MRVQRKVIGKQIDVMRQQQGQALLHPASHTPILGAPEQSVVDKNGVRVRCNGGLNQGTAGTDAGNDPVHLGTTLHLQAIGAVVAKSLRL